MAKYRHVIIGAGRIGAGFQWGDLPYTHAGASQALRDRIELVGFIEPNEERAQSAKLKWQVPVYEDVPMGLKALRPDIVSICVGPDDQIYATGQCIDIANTIKGMWCEKPFMRGPIRMPFPTQVNYLRRGDDFHRDMARNISMHSLKADLHVFAKDDVHTRCHFEDLAKWWGASLTYNRITGPCSYILRVGDGNSWQDHAFLLGGVLDCGEAMKAMLGNLLDHIEGKALLWSPPYDDEKEVHIEL